MLDVGPDDAGGGFRSQRESLGLLGSRRQAEEFLLDDVGDLADATLEDRRGLEQGRLDAPVAVAGAQPLRELLQARPDRRIGWQEVAGATRRSKGRHRAECYTDGMPGSRVILRSRTCAERRMLPFVTNACASAPYSSTSSPA